MDFITGFQLSVVPFIAISTYATAAGYVFADIDATKYFLDLIATPPMYRSTAEILLLLAVRLSVHFFLFPETFRTAAYLCCLGLVMLQRIKLIMITLFKTKNFSLYFRFYRQSLLIYKLVYEPVQLLVCLFLSVAFWFAVFLVWACIKTSPKVISTIVYTWLVSALFCVVVVGFVLLTDFCNALEIAWQTVAIHKLRSKLVFCKTPTKSSRINYYHARSILPLRISYGFFGRFGRDFVGEFFRVFTLRCFDIIILF